MLIKDQILNIKEFKQFFKKLDWVRVPRTLTQDHTDYFYVGLYEDEELLVKVSIRPSLYMQVFETFKNRTVEGKVADKGTTSQRLVNWSSSVEVLVDDSFMKKVKSVAKEQKLNTHQTVSWN